LEYRILARAEISFLEQLDRTESIDYVYHMRKGTLVLEQEHWDVPDWSLSEKQKRIAAMQEYYDKGATFYGAFDGQLLVGMSVLDHNSMPSGDNRLNLTGLWVSCKYRVKGIGRTLLLLIAQAAHERGAKALYVSATPSENTYRFYQSVGFHLAELIDPDLYAKEHDDIHMELVL
jgi:ribosomal protein S18 acetylase RimI-like enzyme